MPKTRSLGHQSAAAGRRARGNCRRPRSDRRQCRLLDEPDRRRALSTAAASSLAHEAAKLRDLVARFKLKGTSGPRVATATANPIASQARALGNKLARAFDGKGAAGVAAHEWEDF